MPKRHQGLGSRTKLNLKPFMTDLSQVILITTIINTAARYKAYEPQLHWYLQIWPRLTTQSGFELGHDQPSIPEEDANFLSS